MADQFSRGRDHHIAIIGAGFSGTLQAINLLRHDGPRATLIERRPRAGRGIAYSAAHPDHLLNVRAGNMSALPDDPDHFVRWLAEIHPGAGGFVPRIIYGDYLAGLLDQAMAAAGNRLALVGREVEDIEPSGSGVAIRLADGQRMHADAAIVAPGNLPPHQPPAMAGVAVDGDIYVDDPWAGDVARGLADTDTVLIIGSGLTMVDIALMLEANDFRGRIVALSRRGLMPHTHADQVMGAPLGQRPPLDVTDLLRDVRARARLSGWRAAVDAMRPFTQDLWLAAAPHQRGRFLRHLRPWWDIHRHRLAPLVAARIAAMRASGRLEIVAGKLADARLLPAGVELRWRPRGSDALETLMARRVVNCSGPQGDLLRTSEPLLRRLLDRGMIRPDAQHLGIDVNPRCEAIDTHGRANPRLLVLGPMTRGTFWEIVAVPDIRVQTWSVARRLSNAHWVGGEGL